MMINSEALRARLNDKSTTDWIDNDKSSLSYKQGFLSGLIKALTLISEVEYLTEHGCERPPIELDLGNEATEGLKIVAGAINDKLKELELTSHSEKYIVEGCIELMESVHQNMLEYMEYMGFEYDRECKEEVPRFNYSYFEIVQQLLLQRTSHGGGTSTRKKCEKLGFDSYKIVTIGEIEQDLEE